ncbi:MAG: YggT family protein, partial [Treponema sp.]|nr:YggT family protein [Treponema sp.]
MIQIFSLLIKGISLYTTLCFVRIILTWIPGLEYSKVGQILSAICDPYLNLFRKIPLNLGNLDFSPMLAIGLLTAMSTILQGIAHSGRVHIGGILALIISLIWSILSAVISMLLLFLVIRFIVMLVSKNKNYYGSVWAQFDSAFSNIVFKLSRPFAKNGALSYKTGLLISIIILVICLFLGKFVINYL